MTYIIAGKLKDKNFMMSDCIVTGDGRKTFTIKTLKLESSDETYYALTGSQFVDSCVRAYDNLLLWNKRQNDFITGADSISELCSYIDQTVITFSGRGTLNLNVARIFFVTKDEVVYYDINFTRENLVENVPKKYVLQEDTFIDSAIKFPASEIKPHDDLHEYCRAHLNMLAKGMVDFKERFSYVELLKDGTKTVKWGGLRASDVIAMYNDINYEKLDDTDFVWELPQVRSPK